jgi:SAM-dependent methyltransferase
VDALALGPAVWDAVVARAGSASPAAAGFGKLAELAVTTNGLRRSLEGARSNWLWLAELSRWERALDLGSGAVPQASGLAEHFATVHCLRLDRPLLGRMWSEFTAEGGANIAPACATPLALPYRDDAFDCVALDDGCAHALVIARGGTSHGIQHRLLQECRRVLRRGGCLYLGTSNAYWWGQATDRRGRSDAVEPLSRSLSATVGHAGRWPPRTSVPSVIGLKHRLARAGFSLVRVYGAEPSYDEPRCIIPLDRRTVLAYELLGRDVSPRGRLRRFLAWLGLHGVLYPSRIYLAYA